MTAEFGIDYFLAKFEAIPEEHWTVGDYEIDGLCCAVGHCGRRCHADTIEACALDELFYKYCGHNAANINDSVDEIPKHETPKERILAALQSFKDRPGYATPRDRGLIF